MASRILDSAGTPLILDGGLATALEAQGHDLSSALWSATLLHSNPSAIRAAHLAYYLSGADVATTASYQASIPGLHAHLGLSAPAALDLIALSVRLAAAARADAHTFHGVARPLLVAGSVGPYGASLANGAEYTGAYGGVTRAELRAFHAPRIAALLGAGADVLACETMPSAVEVEVLCEVLREEFPDAVAWVACSLRDEGRIADGAGLERVVRAVEGCRQVVAVGVNCVPLGMAEGALRRLRGLTDLPLVVYPNSGEEWDAVARCWRGRAPEKGELGDLATAWRGLGARLIGGCCRMGCVDIETIRARLLAGSQGSA